jgi:hypothetical protein
LRLSRRCDYEFRRQERDQGRSGYRDVDSYARERVDGPDDPQVVYGYNNDIAALAGDLEHRARLPLPERGTPTGDSPGAVMREALVGRNCSDDVDKARVPRKGESTTLR